MGFSKTMHGFELESQGHILAKVAKLIDEGRIRTPSVDSLPWSLESLKAQLAKQESGKTIGKLTLSREEAAYMLDGSPFSDGPQVVSIRLLGFAVKMPVTTR